jgi:alpha-1,3-rhamnosyl/mannosyltransferase
MSKNKIFIEGLGLVEGHFSGVGHYINGILSGLDELLEKKKYLEQQDLPEIYVVIPRDTIKKFKKFGYRNIRYKTVPFSFRKMGVLWTRNKLPPLDLFTGKGTFLFTRFVPMPLMFSKSSVIIYDLSYELFKQFAEERNRQFLSQRVSKTIHSVDRVFTISKNAKKEIMNFYRIDEEKVLIAHPAADQKYFYRRSNKEIVRVKNKYEIKGDYILALSNLEPRKNLETLVKAYCTLPKKYRDTISLLLVGVSGWKTDALFQSIIKKVEEGYKIIRPSSYVLDMDIPAVISGAKMLVYPSYYEGFGMPPLEALACGVPVITADNSSLPEVVGKNGKMIKCDDTKGLVESIANYLDDIENVTNKSIIDGPAQASNFSWQKSAKVYWDYFMEANK